MHHAQFLTPNAVRITHSRADGAFPHDRPWLSHVLLAAPPEIPLHSDLTVREQDGCVSIQTLDGHTFFSEARPPRLGLRGMSRALVLDIPNLEIRYERERIDDGVSLSLAIAPSESFYGWGEWFNAFRRERGAVRLKTRDAIALIQNRATYSAIPFFLSTRGYGFLLLNSHASSWRINPDARRLDIQANGPGADYIVIYGPAFRDILATYTALTGRPPLVPRWAFGLFVTGYPQEAQDIVLERVREHRRREIPLDAVILDYHWEERFHNFRWRRALFPDPDKFIADLKALGVRTGVILTPFLNHRNRPIQKFVLNALARNVPRGLERDDERAQPEYDEARAENYFAHADTKWWFGAGGMLDFANPAAAAWWNTRLRALYAQGVAFVKNDDGEYLPSDAQSALGMDGREYHNLYGFLYSRAHYEGQAALDDRRPFIYARSAWVGSQRFPALFLGDQKPTFDHIRSAMRAGLNLSLLGFAYWGADVFGLDGKTTPETHARYAQWALFTPIARYFWRPPVIDATRFPWSHDATVQANFKKYAQLRYRLLPYYYALAWEAYQTGMPIMRPLLLEFPDEPNLGDVCDQVMLGARVMLAPVVEPGATSRRILVPAGTWHDFWSSASYQGGSEIVHPAPLDCLPMLIRGGSILPMGPALAHIADAHRFNELTLHCYPPYPAECVVYDDDGCTRAYQRGEFARTRVGMEGDASRALMRIAPMEGSFAAQPEARRVELVLHRAAPIARVKIDGQVWERWTYEIEAQRAVIPFECRVREGAQVEIEFARAA